MSDGDQLFGLEAKFVSGLNRGETDTVWYDEVFHLIAAARGIPCKTGHAGRLSHFGFMDRETGHITPKGQRCLHQHSATILTVLVGAVLADPDK